MLDALTVMAIVAAVALVGVGLFRPWDRPLTVEELRRFNEALDANAESTIDAIDGLLLERRKAAAFDLLVTRNWSWNFFANGTCNTCSAQGDGLCSQSRTALEYVEEVERRLADGT